MSGMPFKPGDYVRTKPTPKGRFHPWPMIGDGHLGYVKEIDGEMIHVSFTVTLPYFARELVPEAFDAPAREIEPEEDDIASLAAQVLAAGPPIDPTP